MKKKLLTKKNTPIIVIVLLLVIVGCFLILNKKTNFNGDIVSFSYSYGGYNEGYTFYKVYLENGVTRYTAKGMNGIDLKIDREVDSSYLDDLSTIIEKNNIYAWDGFYFKDPFVMDGGGFELEVEYSDGNILNAYGHMIFPKNYDSVHEEILKYFENL